MQKKKIQEIINDNFIHFNNGKSIIEHKLIKIRKRRINKSIKIIR